MRNIEAKINEKVIAGLTEKGFDWFKPWTNAAGLIERPVSWANGRVYRGTNMFMLNFEMIACGYEHNQWLTAKQGYAAGGSNKGETGTPVIFWQQGLKVADKNGKYKFFKKFEEKKAQAFAAKNGTSRSHSGALQKLRKSYSNHLRLLTASWTTGATSQK
jgi:antirestriction protein ArdC